MLCGECLARRESFIKDHYSSQNPFLEGWERLLNADGSIWRDQAHPEEEKCGVDDYFEKYFLWRESVPYETRPAKADEVFGR